MQLLKQNDLLRVGRDYDGGYVISESLMRRSSMLLSFGINDDWSFEEDFCRRTGVTCFGFDFSISKALFLQRGWQQIRFFFGDIIKRRKIQWKRFSEARRHFQLYRSFGRFFRKNVFAGYGIDNASQGYFKTLDEILHEYLPGKEDIFLKVDIEGFEFRIIDDILKNKDRFHALAFEIHDIHNQDNRFHLFMEKLQTGYYTYHIHANNYGSLDMKGGFPNVIEISCIRKDVAGTPDFYGDMSHLPIEGIDFPNNPKAVDLKW